MGLILIFWSLACGEDLVDGRLDGEFVGTGRCLAVSSACCSLAGEDADFETWSKPSSSTMFITGSVAGLVRMVVVAAE